MKTEFVKICKTSEVTTKRPRLFNLDDETDIVLFFLNEKFYAVDNVCPHNHSPLMHEGYIKDDYIFCPVHGFGFNIETGYQKSKDGCRLRTFEVKIEEGFIFVKKNEGKIFDFKFI